MILTTAALLAIATAMSLTGAALVETRPSEALLACAADRYRAARTIERAQDASALAATKGMGAIAPASRHGAEAARLRAEGDDFRQRAASTLSRREISAQYAGQGCPGA